MGQAHSAKNGEKTAKGKGGRPPTLTLEKVKAVGDLIAMGLTEEQACRAEGVNPSTFGPACSRNPEFGNALKDAQAHFLKSAVRLIASGVQGWQGTAWLLERRHKAQFARVENTHGQSTATAANVAAEILSALAEAAQANPMLVPIRQKPTPLTRN